VVLIIHPNQVGEDGLCCVIGHECFEVVEFIQVFTAIVDYVQAAELLLPRIVELRTDCASTTVMLHARRRNDRSSDVERLALQLTSMFS